MLIVCHEQLNCAFGLVMAVITAFVILSTPTAPFYLVTIVFEMDASREGIYSLIFMLILTLLWGVPWLAAILMIFQKDIVREEVCILINLNN